MQLTGPEIKKIMGIPNSKNPELKPNIIITPFEDCCLGSNSYDLHLDKILKIYKNTLPDGMKPGIEYKKNYEYSMRDWFKNSDFYHYYKNNPMECDVRNPKFLLNPLEKQKETIEIIIPENGLILSPDIGYLGSTVEWTETYNLFPYIDGKSSVGRNFILTHHTAGRGDDGFCGNWTLEIKVLYPTVVFPNMRIGQIYYEKFTGARKPYHLNKSSNYINQKGAVGAAALKIEKTK